MDTNFENIEMPDTPPQEIIYREYVIRYFREVFDKYSPLIRGDRFC
jgi:hypothetical protein